MIPIYPDRPNTLCNYAWDYLLFYISEPSFTYCCRTERTKITPEMAQGYGSELFSNLPEHIERRRSLLQNHQHKDCNTCWSLENKGFKSARNDIKFEEYMHRNTGELPITKSDLIDNPSYELSSYANIIEIVLNNTCDAKCTYCSEHYSTQWYAEKKKFNIPMTRESSQIGARDPKVEALFWQWYRDVGMKQLIRFGFIGGEPLITDLIYECFDKLIEIHNASPRLQPVENLLNGDGISKIELCITTNMNTPEAYFQKFLEYLPKLNEHFNVIIQVSGENIGEELEYIRYGVKWNRFKNNLEKLLSLQALVTIDFMPCINLIGLPSLYKYTDYFKHCIEAYYPIHIHRNIVTWPTQQSPMCAPKEFASYFEKPIATFNSLLADEKYKDCKPYHNWVVFRDFLEQTRDAILNNPPMSNMWHTGEEVGIFFEELDKRRNTEFLKTFPEFVTWVQ